MTKLLSLLSVILVTFAPIPVDAANTDRPIRILALGDSLTAGYGLDDVNDAFPAQLERALQAKGYDVTVIQGGISGDTTTGGLARLDWVLGEKPDGVIVALGGNDGLRAVDPAVTLKSMDGIVKRIKKDGLPVLVAGMLAPPNLGRDYGDRFGAVFSKVAKDNDVLLYPFFLEGVAAVPSLNQSDRIHPNVEGVKVMVAGILPKVEELIRQIKDRPSPQ